MKDVDDTPLTFGKFKGKSPEEVSDIKPDYLVWVAETFSTAIPFSEGMYNFCKAEVAKKKNREKEANNES